jgi:hypothetical protein
MPPPAGIVYAPDVLNVRLVIENEPEILNVPLRRLRYPPGPSVFPPCNVKLDGLSSRMFAIAPLLTVIERMSVVAPVPPNVLLAAPVKLMPAPASPPLVLRSRVPLFVRSPLTPNTRTSEPVAGVWRVPPLSIDRFMA